MYLLAPFILQKFKKILELIQSRFRVMKMCHFWAQNDTFVLNKFFWYKPSLLLSSTYWPFSLCKIKKKILQQIQSYEDAPFLRPKWSICPKEKFLLEKIINIIFIYLLAPFIVQNIKKIWKWIQSYEDAPFLGPKWPIFPNDLFYIKPVNKTCSFHSCLSSCQKSKSYINLLMK